ncbi:MAG TPA: BTAD domain-containing putative transcriptional regulator, partial [Acidimicrobiales bacterium]|nr:BTAD domain-containing putative transcriptional regulator [Acidimicrobiales bacterium]
LAAELVDHWRSVGVAVALEPASGSASLLAAHLAEAAREAGFTDAAVAAGSKADPTDVVDTLSAALAEERCTFVVDDAHFASAEAGLLVDRLATRLRGDQRLVVLARQLPDGAKRLRRAEYLQLTAADLAMDASETLRVCRSGFGLDVGPEAAADLGRATGGWTAVTVLAAARAARTGEAVTAVAQAASGPHHPAGALAAILDEAVTTLGPTCRPQLAQLARLPLVDAPMLETVFGERELFASWQRAGIPFTPARGTWWDLPGPVRDYLASFSSPARATMRRAAHHYRQREEMGLALDLLLAVGDDEEAAAVLGSTPPEVEETLDTFELLARFEQLPGSAVDDHPSVLVLVARRLGHAGRYARCCALLDRAGEIARRTGDQQLGRSASAELVKVRLLAEMRYDEAEHAARKVLAVTGADERLTRARANEFLGYALCKRYACDASADERLLDEAEDCLAQALESYRRLGMRSAASFVSVDCAVHIEFPRGRLDAAMDRIEEALKMVVDRPRAFGFVMISRAQFAAELGDDELCRASVGEVFRVAEQIHSGFLRAQGHWKLAASASYRGDADATLDHLRQVEVHAKAWWDLGSGEFLAEAADLLDRVGHTSLARDYLARVLAEPKDAGHLAALVEAAIEARHGDPVLAEQKLCELLSGRVDRRERWRVTLLRAFAALRRGDTVAAGALGAHAFEEAALLGQPQVPLIRERQVTEQLLGLALETGHPSASSLHASALPLSLRVLGRFELTRGGRPLQLSTGQEAQLLKLLAVSGGRLHSEQVIDALWPEAAVGPGRHRLRTVLNRLRNLAGDVVLRDGDLLVLDPALRIDVAALLEDTRRAEALSATDPTAAAALARGAVVHYRGELLPDDPYAEWAEVPREAAKRTVLELLELLTNVATAHGDLDGTRWAVERAVDLAPEDDRWYARAVETLAAQGRRGAALAVLRRARRELDAQGFELPNRLVALERSLVSRAS